MNAQERGKKIKKARQDVGLSQEAVAEMLQVSSQAVSKWERGLTYPERNKWAQLEAMLHLPKGWFFALQEDEQPGVDVAQPMGNRAVVETTGQNVAVNHSTVTDNSVVAGIVQTARVHPAPAGDIANNLCQLIRDRMAGLDMDEQIELRAKVKRVLEEE